MYLQRIAFGQTGIRGMIVVQPVAQEHEKELGTRLRQRMEEQSVQESRPIQEFVT